MKKIYKVLSIFFIILFSFLFIPVDKITAHAASNESFAVPYPYEITRNSNVMIDLSSISGFRTSKYNYSDVELYDVEVVALVETKQNDLIIYTFEPHHIGSEENIQTIYNLSDFSNKYSTIFTPSYITSVNISKTIGDELSIRNYDLTFVKSYYSQFGVFSKFIVEDFEVESSLVRYYEIPSIFSTLTPSGLDVSSLNTQTQTVNEQGYKVACRYRFETKSDGKINVYFEGTKVVTITNKFVGYVRYKNTTTPAWIDNNSCDRHFVAFSTDMQIDKLKEADVCFVSQSMRKEMAIYGTDVYYGEKVKYNPKTLSYTNSILIENSGGNGLFWTGCTYSWNEIQNISEFEQSVNFTNVYKKGIFNSTAESTLTTSEKNQLLSNDYVLSFHISDYYYLLETSAPVEIIEKEIVGEVSILRLRFETAGVEYNLGVVDNKQTGSLEPVNTMTVSSGISLPNLSDMFNNFEDLLKLILGVFAIILLLVILGPVLPVIINLIVLLLKSILNILSLPFKAAFKGKKKRK